MDNKFRVMIAEDDTRLRQYLMSLLSTFPEIEIIAAAPNGRELMRQAGEDQPDIVFLDVEMPELDGFSTAIQLLEIHPKTAVVFITGHVEEGIRGYDIGASDYLSKPISRENLARSIDRAKDTLQIKGVYRQNKGDDRLVVKNGREIFFIDPDQINFIEKVNRLCVIHTLEKVYYSTEALDALAVRLNDRFLRSHRGYIINIDRVEKIEPESDSSLSVSFYGFNSSALLSKNKLDEFMLRLAGKTV